ncbi:MAG: SirB2 family protein [Aquabacterium sp.]
MLIEPAQLLSLHRWLVVASLGLFAVRGLAVLLRAAWPLRRLPRVASVLLDTALLASGVALAWRAGLLPAVPAWLGLKLGLLLLYVVLGTVAFRGSPGRRPWAYGAALLCAGAMVGIARARDPAGWFAMV